MLDLKLIDELKTEIAMLADKVAQLLRHPAINAPVASKTPLPATLPTVTTQPTPMPPTPNIDTLLPWTSQDNNWHNIRVLCDLSGLDLLTKNDLTACVDVESQFLNYYANGKPVMHDNGTSKDWGMFQINDFWHIGVHKDFASVDFVMANPQVCGQFMVDMFKAGKADMWSSHKSGVYKDHLALAAIKPSERSHV